MQRYSEQFEAVWVSCWCFGRSMDHTQWTSGRGGQKVTAVGSLCVYVGGVVPERPVLGMAECIMLSRWS